MSKLLKVANAACNTHSEKTASGHWFQEAMGVPEYYHDIPMKKQNVGNMNRTEAQAELDYLNSPEGLAATKHMANRQGDVASLIAGGIIAGAGRSMGASRLSSLGVGAASALGLAAMQRGINYILPDEYQTSGRRVWLEQRLRKIKEQGK